MEQGRKRRWDDMMWPPHDSAGRRDHAPSTDSPVSKARLCGPPRFTSLEQVIQNIVCMEVQAVLGCSNPNYRNPPQTKLVFTNKVNTTLYANDDIVDETNNPIQITLVDTNTGDICKDPALDTKVEIVVLEGDFGEEHWSSEDFENKIVNPRSGKGPLLAGALTIVLEEGIGKLKDLFFTDNSSWVRSRRFRLGARVCASSSTHYTSSIREALSNPFTVKDHQLRVTVPQKHQQERPMLNDAVWRLNKIPKYGVYHFRLKSKWINSVQDFLRMIYTSSTELREILQMPNKDWDEVIRDAITCLIGDDMYLFKSKGTVIKFNPIGVILEASIDGENSSYEDLNPEHRARVDQLALEAYQQWTHLEKVSADSESSSAPQSPTLSSSSQH